MLAHPRDSQHPKDGHNPSARGRVNEQSAVQLYKGILFSLNRQQVLTCATWRDLGDCISCRHRDKIPRIGGNSRSYVPAVGRREPGAAQAGLASEAPSPWPADGAPWCLLFLGEHQSSQTGTPPTLRTLFNLRYLQMQSYRGYGFHIGILRGGFSPEQWYCAAQANKPDRGAPARFTHRGSPEQPRL